MPEETELDTTPAREQPSPGEFVPIEQISPEDPPEVLTRKVENVVRQIGDGVIKEAFVAGNVDLLGDRDALLALVGERIRFEAAEGAPADFVERVETAVIEALTSQGDYITLKATGARLGAVLGVGYGFAIVADLTITALRGLAMGADPVSLSSGQFTYAATDLRLDGAGMDFVFTRTYASHAFSAGPLGPGWDHSYNLWLRVEPDEQRITRANGALREDLYVRQELHDYWVPPPGTDGVIVREGGSLVWRAPDGTRYVYAADGGEPLLHLIARIEDRFGNHLAFAYQDRMLRSVEVNHPLRIVRLDYDDGGRLSALRDFTGRTWHYCHDDLADLVSVTSPASGDHPWGLTTSYEYSTAQRTGDLQHNMLRIVDPAGRTFVENEYGAEPGTLGFDRVIRQRQGSGETLFDYENVQDAFEVELSDAESPTSQTIVTERSGQMVRHVFNRFGNQLLREECVSVGGVPRAARTHYRYNADGNLVASLSPEGVMTQYLNGREEFLRRNPVEDEQELQQHPNLTIQERQAFGRVLAIVRRARRFTLLDLDLSRTVWGDMFPDVIGALEPDGEGGTRDVVTKSTYEPVYGQLVTQSDPRFTDSADPARQDAPTGENARYEETLTRYVYDGPPADPSRFLVEIVRPAPTFPDGTRGDPIVEAFRRADGTPGYDDHGRRLRRTDALGSVTEHEYLPDDPTTPRAGHLAAVTVDPTGLELTTRFDVDDLGRVVATTHPRAAEAADGRFVSRDVLDALDRVVETVGSEPFAHSVRRSYGCSGELERVERDLLDADAQEEHGGVEVRTYAYDEELHLLAEGIGGRDGATPLVTRHHYDAAGQRVLTTRPSGTRVAYRYDGRLLPVAQVLGSGTAGSATARIEYDGDGRVRRGINPRGEVTTYEVDTLGRVIAREDALGHVTRTSYDKAGNVVCVRSFELRGDGYHLLARSESGYDELNRLSSTAFNLFDADPVAVPEDQLDDAHLASPGPGRLLVSQRFHDAGGQVTREVDPLGRETRRGYDAAGRMTLSVDALGNETRLSLDAHGNVVRSDRVELIRGADGAITGRRTFSTVSAYDELDRLAQVRDSLGNVTRYRYDSRDNPTVRIDPLGNEVRFRFDVFGRRIAAVAGGEVTTSFQYDGNGNPVAITDPLGRRTAQRFDPLDRRTAVVHADGSKTRFAYDRSGNLERIVDANGCERRFTVDARNRVVAVVVAGGGDGETFEGFAYDALDRCLQAENDFAVCEYTYNSLGWALTESVRYTTPAAPFAPVLTVRREFDDVGAVSGVEYPGGRRLGMVRDALDRLTLLRNVANGADHPGSQLPNEYDVAAMSYSGRQRSRCTFENGRRTSYAYDAGARVIEIEHDGEAGPLLTMQYAYDATGALRLRHDLAPGEDAELYAYDALHQLVEQRRAGRAPFDPDRFEPPTDPPDVIPDLQREIDELFDTAGLPERPPAFDYDAAGNREVERGDGGEVPYTVNALDEYLTRADRAFSYDANGNLVSDGQRRYRYDCVDRLVGVDDLETGAIVARYHHDARGRRILEIEDGVATHLLWDAANLVGEYRDGRLFASYVFDEGVDRPLQVATGGLEAWYHCDLLGSVRALTDRSGVPIASYSYSPFGGDLAASGTVHNPLRHDARRRSAVLGTYDHRARQYDPVLGRFLQRDPTGMVDSTNPYTYARNSPLTATDPWGTETRSEQSEDPMEAYFRDQRQALERRAGRHPQDRKHQQAFEMYGLILDEIERSARSGRPVDLKDLWEQARDWNWDWKNTSWMHLCSKCYENPNFAETGPFPEREVAGVDTVAVFSAVTADGPPNPSLASRIIQDLALAFLVFGPGFAGGAVRGTLEGTVARGVARPAVMAEQMALVEARAPLVAEAAGGTRMWLVGRGGSATTRGLRFTGNRITYDTLAPGKSGLVRQDMGAISNIMGLRGEGFFRQGTWWTGTHGTPQGAFGGQHLELKFLRTDRQVGRYYNWKAETVFGRDPAAILSGGLERPTVYAWCYSSSCFVVPPL